VRSPGALGLLGADQRAELFKTLKRIEYFLVVDFNQIIKVRNKEGKTPDFLHYSGGGKSSPRLSFHQLLPYQTQNDLWFFNAPMASK